MSYKLVMLHMHFADLCELRGGCRADVEASVPHHTLRFGLQTVHNSKSSGEKMQLLLL